MATPVPKAMGEGADVCPTEEAVKAFLDYLVEPKIPQKSYAGFTPSLSDQESVAKQVHAVVLLYNYYYRKQHPHLECLGFKSFCKLCAIFKHGLMSYLNFMVSSDSAPEELEKLLSLTEKNVMDACDICATLDITRNSPSLDGWPISKVAIFLVDSEKQNCMLHYGSIIDGVWSMIEKDVDSSSTHLEGVVDACNINKKRRVLKRSSKDSLRVDEASLEKLAYAAIKEATGIDQNDLEVLESHVTYSISKEKAAARLYIIKCTQSNSDGQIKIPIVDAINSLQGPLLTKSSSGWTHTSVVEYFHLLPYHGLLLDWVSRDVNVGNMPVPELRTELMDADNLESTGIFCENEYLEAHLGSNISSSSGLANQNDNRKDTDLLKQNNEGKISEGIILSGLDGNHCEQVDKTLAVNCLNGNSNNADCEGQLLVVKEVGSSAQRCLNGLSSSSKDEAVDMSHQITECMCDSSGHGNEKHITTSSYRSEMPTNGHAIVAHRSNDLDKLHGFIASKDKELSLAALRVLLVKRDKLSLQLRDLEDQIAQCDKDIHSISNEGEDVMALKIQSVIDGCSSACVRGVIQSTGYQPGEDCHWTHPAKRMKVLASQHVAENPCQALDHLCYANNWILPTYHVSVQDGQFQANVFVKANKFEHSSSGSLRANPGEARASAASEMLDKLLWDNHQAMSQECLTTSYLPSNDPSLDASCLP